MGFWIRSIYTLLLLFALHNGAQAAGSRTDLPAAPPDVTLSTHLADQNAPGIKSACPEALFPKNTFSKPAKARIRFQIPDSGFQFPECYAPVAEAAIVALILALIIAAYRQPYYLSQQYAYLFRLTPF